MIVIKLQGGLGNQLFQFAAYSKLLEQGKNVYLDVGEYNLPENGGFRKYLLNEFIITNELSLCIFSDSLKIKIKHKILNTNIRVFSTKKLKSLKNENIRHGNNLSDDLNEIKDNSYITGYFLNERFFPKNLNKQIYFNENNKQIQTVLNLPKKIIQENSVSIHLRRNDYLDKNNFIEYGNICTTEYYKKAINYFTKQEKKYHFYFFSDDINWVKKEFGTSNNYTFIENPENVDTTISDLFLMSSCKNNIIANSTYSWWGAFFNKNANKIIIRPSKYQNTTDTKLYPDNWIDINTILE